MDIEVGLRVVVYASTWLNKGYKGKYTTPLLGTVHEVQSNRVIVAPDATKFGKVKLSPREIWLNEAYVHSYWERGHQVTLALYKELNPPHPPTDPDTAEAMVDLEKRMRLLEKKMTILLNHTSDTYAIGQINIDPQDL